MVLLSAVLSGSTEQQTPAPVSFQEVASRVREHTLSNGMKFIVLERHQAPVFSGLIYADVGAAQETKGITGLAHVFEHMAFKGTEIIGTREPEAERAALERVDQAFAALAAERLKGERADPEKLKELEARFSAAQQEAERYVVRNEFGEIIERAGGRNLNATTSWDRTNYFFSLPSNMLELWFYLESERFLNPVLREFYQEKNVVMEERRMRTESNPIGKLLEEFLAVAYKAHPYGEPVVGHMSDLRNLTRADAEAFWKKYYVPANLIAVVVGDVDSARVQELAERYFGRLPAAPRPAPLRTVEPPQQGERRVTLRLQAQRLVVLGYHKPSVNHPDDAVYDAVGSLLSDGRSSRLHRRLVRDKRLAVAAGGFPGLPGQKYPGLFLFYAFTAPGRSNEEVERAIGEEIERLKSEPVSQEELQGVKRRARASFLRRLDSSVELAVALSEAQGLTGDWRNLFRQLERIDAVSAPDIQRVATETFQPANRTVGIIEPVEPSAGAEQR
jgi:predicted Zn-dependent peptidase